MIEYYGICDDYSIFEEIAAPSFANVRVAYKNGIKYCFKYLEINNSNSEFKKKCIKNEAAFLQSLCNPGIVKIIDYKFDSYVVLNNGSSIPIMYIVLEFLSGGSLFEIVHENGRMSENIARYFFWQLINALKYINEKGIIHRDLKLENLMIDENLNLKLIDFGLSISREESTKPELRSQNPPGTEGFLPPEVIEYGSYYSEKTDIFAAGIILFILITKRYPLRSADKFDKYYSYMFTEKNRNQFWILHERNVGKNIFFFEIKNLLEGMLEKDPQTRWGFADILNHPWFKFSTSSTEEIKNTYLKKSIV